MVKTLHAAGIEVILDVVYNHTVEGEFVERLEVLRIVQGRQGSKAAGQGRAGQGRSWWASLGRAGALPCGAGGRATWLCAAEMQVL